MKTLSRTLVVMLVVVVAGCTTKETPEDTAASASSPLETVASARQIMLGITIPSSDVIFQVAMNEPADDAGWDKVEASAASLAESAILLMQGARAVDQGEWLAHCKALLERSKLAAQAARERSVDKVLEVGDQIYEVCDACHQKYMAARQGL